MARRNLWASVRSLRWHQSRTDCFISVDMLAWMVWLAFGCVVVCIGVSPFIKSIYVGFGCCWMAGGDVSGSCTPADFGRTKRRVSNHMIHDPSRQRLTLAPNSGPSLMRYRRLCLAKTDEGIVIRYRSPSLRVVDHRADLAVASLNAK